MDTRRYAFPASLRVCLPSPSRPSGPAESVQPLDPVSRYCLVAPLLRRDLDQLRGRVGTSEESWGDRARLEVMSLRLAELLRVTFG